MNSFKQYITISEDMPPNGVLQQELIYSYTNLTKLIKVLKRRPFYFESVIGVSEMYDDLRDRVYKMTFGYAYQFAVRRVLGGKMDAYIAYMSAYGGTKLYVEYPTLFVSDDLLKYHILTDKDKRNILKLILIHAGVKDMLIVLNRTTSRSMLEQCAGIAPNFQLLRLIEQQIEDGVDDNVFIDILRKLKVSPANIIKVKTNLGMKIGDTELTDDVLAGLV